MAPREGDLITGPLVETQASRSAWLTFYGFKAVWKRVVFRSVVHRARTRRRNERCSQLLSLQALDRQ